ncbi:MAG: thermonuclease family protein [Planctomycetes bacterium]|nr:thermonuclease family protein [Planctomycetota bacterium]
MKNYAMSKRRRNILLVICAIAVVALIRLDQGNYKNKQHSKHKVKAQSSDFEKYNAKTFTVVNVVDGDTIDINIPDGQYENTRIRLWGVDTPETKNEKFGVMYFGPRATEFTKKSVLKKQVRIYLENKRTRGKYNRLLAYVQMPNDRFLNEVLLSEGFAYCDLRFNHSFYNKYKQLEAAARSSKKGLWKNVTRTQLPQWLQREKPNLLLKN